MSITLKTIFHVGGQSERWKNKVANDLNELLGRAEYQQQVCNDEADKKFIKATLSIVQRIAEFEEIETVEQIKTARQQL